MEETIDVGASDSPEATPGSALHRFGKARRKLARRLRGPRRLARLYSQDAQSDNEFNDAGDSAKQWQTLFVCTHCCKSHGTQHR